MSKSDKNKARRKRKRHLDEQEKASRTPGILKLAQIAPGFPTPLKQRSQVLQRSPWGLSISLKTKVKRL